MTESSSSVIISSSSIGSGVDLFNRNDRRREDSFFLDCGAGAGVVDAAAAVAGAGGGAGDGAFAGDEGGDEGGEGIGDEGEVGLLLTPRDNSLIKTV